MPSATSFASSLQGLLSFVACTQQEELQELRSHGCRCVFYSTQTLTFAAIERDVYSDQTDNTSSFSVTCLEHLLHLLQSQLRFLLSDQGLHVLQRQPNYDLCQRLHGTERVTRSLTGLWAVHPTLRFKDFGVPFVRLQLAGRRQVTRMLAAAGEAETEHLTSAMICAVLLAKEKVVAIAQPKKKQFSMRVDDLLLLIDFVYHAPSLAASETWTPVCLPHFSPRGFLYAYVAFLTTDVCLLLLSSQPSPEQCPHFQAKKVFVARRLEDSGAMDDIRASLRNHSEWRPHRDLPLLLHFIYKNELTGECAEPALGFPFDDADFHTRLQLLNAYATVHHLMFPSLADPHSLRASQVLAECLLSLQDDTAASSCKDKRRSAKRQRYNNKVA
ncbi:unnamed protein product [Hyaloperonospora brassicae]|uniref:Vacuolar fusion protein MON1 homolog n=1 Tax=Hyaloperonospora brassicae TaxID=162125 RepID=A0AAV0UMG2_HYABA|nr:unnamed protein product [Hyaloperonospora brassicae]